MGARKPRLTGDPSLSSAEARKGFTLIDVAVALLIVLATASGLLGVVFSALKVSQGNEETARAEAAAREIAESLRETPFDQVFAAFQLANQSGFAVEGFGARPEDPDGLVGEIRFPVIQTANGFELREDVVDGFLGMPRDLDGDDEEDSLDHALDYELLPVEIRVEWSGGAGERSVRLGVLLGPDS